MKTCTKCQVSKPEDDFSWKNKKSGKRNSRCSECTRAAIRDHYQKNKEYYLQKTERHKRACAELVREAKTVPCADCEKSYPYYVMDYDHVGEKNFALAHAALKSGRLKILEEMAKCDVVCSNCHRERTHQRRLDTSSVYP